MDIFSILLFFIYSLLILGILVFVSPLLSAFIMILIPVVFVFILPDEAAGFVSIIQFSYSGIQVFNLHILLIIWSAFIGVISYHKVLTWYLLRESAPVVKDAATAAAPSVADQPKTLIFKVKDFLQKLYKILKGEKIKLKS
ncbi:MAG: hypothetical protein MPEBLZ_04284 [Candidatus Methanoperedens nitroreducens]|uniref:Uncharacterized protein n=1 Tax=Candidatus Methanoperedens nitratireducens TaxID=1392998 RepID=A0A0P8CF90_9EURY|nr:hypothetical protein [Candidatus Methanoperedens sp. BLZ2]KAB2946596.1 MAG: hypothetical protein F9K14_06985 [Candidatus Methanoperedens sp.]KPQ41171.1 MAG: hypothetical protein MPEBLZ_04284 [Candidatus Methanoperedens sp. BLZ1]MBZ0173929.1 hypothetical protein [Candidatus Methanoperedens nitroreducens]CAG0999318.1 hypothetical protein METP2_03143 [Methanosarcinales archaeon]MCX9078968.1 hypothetical protein [Candidatus Methanoperedens sp.]